MPNIVSETDQLVSSLGSRTTLTMQLGYLNTPNVDSELQRSSTAVANNIGSLSLPDSVAATGVDQAMPQRTVASNSQTVRPTGRRANGLDRFIAYVCGGAS